MAIDFEIGPSLDERLSGHERVKSPGRQAEMGNGCFFRSLTDVVDLDRCKVLALFSDPDMVSYVSKRWPLGAVHMQRHLMEGDLVEGRCMEMKAQAQWI